MNHLFTKTSQVLRDNWISELQNSNDFLKNKLSNINVNPFFGYKVKIKEHYINVGTNFINETEGVIYNIGKGIAWVLYKNKENEKKINSFHLKHIEFIDPKFDKYF
jgi:hypothetical protein